MAFVFSSTDPGLEVLLREAAPVVRRLRRENALVVTTIDEADHTFSLKADRAQLIARLVDTARAPVPLSLTRVPASRDLWQEIEGAWTTLLAQTNETSAFLSAEWMRHWIGAYWVRARPTGLIWSAPDGTVVGCAVISRGGGAFGPFRVARHFLNASGVDDAGPEHNDVMALPAFRADVTQSLHAEMGGGSVDQIALVGVRSSLFDDLLTLSGDPDGWRGYKSESPYVSLGSLRAKGQSFMEEISSNTRQQVRRSLRLYEDLYGTIEARPAESLQEALDWYVEMLELHDATWAARETSSGFVPESRAFHRSLLTRYHEARDDGGLQVCLFRIRAGTETIGVLHFLVTAGCVHFHQGGLRYDEDGRLKPGLVSHYLAIQHFMEGDAVEYDFLGGEPNPVRYKRSLSTDVRELYWAQIPCPTRRMRLLQLAVNARNAGSADH